MRTILTALCLATASVSTLAVASAQTAPKKYSAAQFYETESVSIGGAGDDAFTSDGKHLLISSDRTGVFNAYLLPLAGGDPIALTRSTTDATYAISVFPKDDRVLVQHDMAVTNSAIFMSAQPMAH